MRFILLLVGALLVGVPVALIAEASEPDLDPADYPTCSAIAINPGTDPNAHCVDDDGGVIVVKDYEVWVR